MGKKVITAEDIISGARAAKPAEVVRRKVPFFKVKLVKGRDLRLPIESISTQADLVYIAKAELASLPHEEVLAIGLDGTNRIIGVVKVSQGGIGSAAMTAKDVIRPLLGMGATGFVVAHNHPSGDPRASREDYVLTDHLKKAAACVDLTMLDHIVIGGVRGGGYTEIMNRYATGTFARDDEHES